MAHRVRPINGGGVHRLKAWKIRSRQKGPVQLSDEAAFCTKKNAIMCRTGPDFERLLIPEEKQSHE
jgi:hypothetical protein